MKAQQLRTQLNKSIELNKYYNEDTDMVSKGPADSQFRKHLYLIKACLEWHLTVCFKNNVKRKPNKGLNKHNAY